MTPAVRVGRYLEWAAVAAGIALMLAAWAASRRGYDAKRMKATETPKEN